MLKTAISTADTPANSIISRPFFIAHLDFRGTVHPQVNPPSPNLRFMIAGHSPQGFLESRTVHCGSREKPGNRGPTSQTVCSLQSGLSGKIAKYGHYSRISAESEWNFSAVQTAWRRGMNSNPRYRSETCKSRRLRKLHGIN